MSACFDSCLCVKCKLLLITEGTWSKGKQIQLDQEVFGAGSKEAREIRGRRIRGEVVGFSTQISSLSRMVCVKLLLVDIVA